MSLLKCGHHVAPPVPRKRETQRKQLREGWGAPGTTEESMKTQNPFLLFCVHLCVGLPHGSPVNAQREVRQVSLQLTAEGRGLPGDHYQFWGWRPLKIKRAAAAQRANYHVDIRLSIFHDLEHHSTLRSERVGLVLW